MACPKPEFYMIFARKMPEFNIIIARKIRFPIFFFWGGAHAPYPPRLLRLWEATIKHGKTPCIELHIKKQRVTVTRYI